MVWACAAISAVSSASAGVVRVAVLRIVPGQGVLDKPGHEFTRAVLRRDLAGQLEGPHPQVRGRDPGQHRARRHPAVTPYPVPGRRRGEHSRGRHAQGVHGFAEEVLAQYR